MIKYTNFQLYRVPPDGVIKKIWQLTRNLQTNQFDFLYINDVLRRKKLLVRHNKVAK